MEYGLHKNSYVFKGANGSLGYVTGKAYELHILNARTGVSITRADGQGACDYSSIGKFLENWTPDNNELHRKIDLRDGIVELIQKMELPELKNLIFWWWSESQIADRIIEEMDDDYIYQKSYDDLKDELNHVKKIASGNVVDISSLGHNFFGGLTVCKSKYIPKGQIVVNEDDYNAVFGKNTVHNKG